MGKAQPGATDFVHVFMTLNRRETLAIGAST